MAARVATEVAQGGAGERVALVSDAGTPEISDPGYMAVRACLEREARGHLPTGGYSLCACTGGVRAT